MGGPYELPPEFDPLLVELADQPEPIREMWCYALVLMMIDDEKARIISSQLENGQEVIAVRTIAGDEFEIERPAVSAETEGMLFAEIRRIVTEETGS